MNQIQTIALWFAAVSLVVIALFTTLNYFDADAHREVEIAHWERAEDLACINTLTALAEINRSPGTRDLEPTQEILDEIQDCLAALKSDR